MMSSLGFRYGEVTWISTNALLWSAPRILLLQNTAGAVWVQFGLRNDLHWVADEDVKVLALRERFSTCSPTPMGWKALLVLAKIEAKG